jgi:natural product biosynthesis luciferase-like monooxygenase protein/amino acid adenylation domain-containing protein
MISRSILIEKSFDADSKVKTLLEALWFFVVAKFKYSECLDSKITLIEWIRNPPEQPSNSMRWACAIEDQQWVLRLDYDAAIFSDALLSQVSDSYLFLLGDIEKILPRYIEDISIVSPKQMLWWHNWNNTAFSFDSPQTLSECFSKTAKALSDAVAVISTSRCLTYGELDILSSRVAANLVARHLHQTVPVAVIGERGWELIVTILGIVKAGLPYLFLNAKDPGARINSILDEAQPSLVLTQAQCMDLILFASESEQHVITQQIAPNSIAYLIYTSGSTGQPKGVAISHAAVLNTVDDMVMRLNLNEQDRILSISGLGFDLSVFDMFGAFRVGAAIVLLDEADSRNPQVWVDLIHTHHVTIWNSVPALMALMLEHLKLSPSSGGATVLPLRWVLLSGDFIPQNLPEKIQHYVGADCRILELGGSTEASIWSIGSEITHWDSQEPVPYGRPLKNQQIYIVDDHDFLLPPGAIGEIVIAGQGLASCYWRNPALTSSRFPNITGIGRVFKCRDAGKMNLDNALIEFMGRLDRQAKAQGNRIDLTEIEQALCKVKAVESAVVLVQQSDGCDVVALLKAYPLQESIPEDREIRSLLTGILSSAMIPKRYIWMDQWPLTANGKIDFKCLSERIATQNSVKQSPMPLKPSKRQYYKSQEFPVPPNQQGMLYELIKKARGTYTIAITLHYQQSLNRIILERACQQLVSEFDVLRQSFKKIDSAESISVMLHQPFTVPFAYFDWSRYEKSQIDLWLIARKERVMNQGLNPFQPRALYIEHFHLPNEQDKIHFFYSHLLFDAGSLTPVVNRLHQIYHEIEQQQKASMTSQQSIAEFLNFRVDYDMKEHQAFWRQQLIGLEEASLITGSELQDGVSQSFFIQMSELECAQIQEFSKTYKVSATALLQGCWSLLLASWLNQTTVVSGLVYSGKNKLPIEWNNATGCFINTLPLIVTVDPERSFADWMRQIKQNIQSLMKHDISSLLEITQSSGMNIAGYFDSVFTALSFRRPDFFGVPALVQVDYDQITDFPLTIQFDPIKMELCLKFRPTELPTEIWPLIVSAYHSIIEQALNNPHRLLKDFRLFNLENEQSWAIIYGKSTPQPLDIISCFQRQVQKNPQRLACITDAQEWTYQQLSEQVQNLAIYLKSQNIHTALGVFLPRGGAWVVTILACLTAGIPFMPLGLDWPDIRLHKRLHEADCHDILLAQDHINPISGVRFHVYPEIFASSQGVSFINNDHLPGSIAYILFTSGSTGQGKGVAVPRSALNNNITALSDELKVCSDDIWLSVTQTTFDILLLEVLAPLCAGSTLLLPSDAVIADFMRLQALVHKHQPTFLQTTPSRWKLFLDEGLPLSSFRILLVGGEALPLELFQRLSARQKKVINLYGPTEATIWATLAQLNFNEPIHVGRPLANCFCVVVNQFNQILPHGVKGELCIGGAALAEGYLDSIQTTQSFVSLAISSDKTVRVYKTGDKAWISPEGRIYFVGRQDRQLKLRGQRLDPVEIENVLCATGLVESAVVMTAPSDSQSLVAYLQVKKKKAHSMRMSLFCFPEVEAPQKNNFDFYKLLAKKADQAGLYGMWTPERHFDPMGAVFSTPAVVTAALAAITENLVLGAGSVVLPLHHPVIVAEQWATLDCLYNGRVRLSIASGWHPNDFIFAPEQYQDRKQVMFEKLKILKNIWAHGVYEGKNGADELRSLSVYPRPTQAGCPLWLTVADDVEVFAEAGRLGLNILTHLLIQDLDALAKKLRVYRQNLTEHGFDPLQKHVTLMVHTYIHPESGVAREEVKKPLQEYFRAHMRLLTKIQNEASSDIGNTLSEAYFENLVERFIEQKCLIGTPQQCAEFAVKLQEAGVTEIASLIDFGMPEANILEGVEQIAQLQAMIPQEFCRESCDLNELRHILSKELPPVMLPSHFIFLNEMPLTANGKIDFQALKLLYKESTSPVMTLHQPDQGDPLVQKILLIWCKVLRREQIDLSLSFFENGGHSLRAIELLSKVNEVLGVKVSLTQFLNQPWFDDLLHIIREKAITERPEVESTQQINLDKEPLPLSAMQKGIWVFSRFFPEAVCYHDAFLYQVLWPTSDESVVQGLDLILKNEPFFRIGFFEENHGVVQKVGAEMPHVQLKKYAHSAPENIANDALFLGALREFIDPPFNLTEPPLLRVVVHSFSDSLYVQLVLHHIITDGRSLLNLLSRLKHWLRHGVLPSAPKSYLEYVKNAVDDEVDPKSVKNYIEVMGLQRLKNTLRSSLQPPLVRSFKGFQQRLHLNKDLLVALKKLAAQSSATANTVLLAAFAKVLFAFINEDHLQIALPISLRGEEEQDCIGLFINFGVLALQRHKTDRWSPEHWIAEIKRKSTMILEYRDIPFAKIASAVGATLLTDAQPLSQFVFNAFDRGAEDGRGFQAVQLDYGMARFDLELQVAWSEDEADLTFIFSQDVFSRENASGLVNAFERVLLSLSSAQNQKNEGVLAYWSAIYDDLYHGVSDLNMQPWLGWNNSVDGHPFSSEVMQDWLHDIAAKIKREPLGRVLEVGCGTGQVMKALEKKYIQYLGVDLSAAVIEKLASTYQDKDTQFKVLAADELNILPGTFDTIILNSVVQYFPSLEYFELVLEQAIALLNPQGGRIILGDLRHADWQGCFYEYVRQAKCAQGVNDCKQLNDYHLLEKELFVSPRFIMQIIQKASFSLVPLFEPKLMHFSNELRDFRYTATLHVLPKANKVEADRGPPIVFKGAQWSSLSQLREWLMSQLPFVQGSLIITGLTNTRLYSMEEGGDLTVLHDEIQKMGLQAFMVLHPGRPEQFLCCVSRQENFVPMLLDINQVIEADADVAISSLVDQPVLSEVLLPSQSIVSANHVEIQAKLMDIWHELLGIDEIQPTDSFFDLGGDSMLYIRLFSKIIELGYVIKMSDLLSRHSIAEQAKFLHEATLGR